MNHLSQNMKFVILVGIFSFNVPTSFAAGIQGPLKKFPFHQDGLYSRETTTTVMGMTNKQSGDACFAQSDADYSGHVPEATKCTTEVIKDTASEGTWKAQCVLESGDKVKIISTITHVDPKTVRATFDIDAPQGVKVTGQHLFKFLNAKCPPKTETKTETKKIGSKISTGNRRTFGLREVQKRDGHVPKYPS